jgi:hypothetical protein
MMNKNNQPAPKFEERKTLINNKEDNNDEVAIIRVRTNIRAGNFDASTEGAPAC